MKQFTKFPEIFSNSEANIEDHTSKYQTEMKMKNKEKNQVIEYCISKLVDAERKAEQDSIAKIEEFKKFRKHVYRKIEADKATEQKEPDYDAEQDKLEIKLKELQVVLLDIEVKLQEVLKQKGKDFKSKVESCISDMKLYTEVYM